MADDTLSSLADKLAAEMDEMGGGAEATPGGDFEPSAAETVPGKKYELSSAQDRNLELILDIPLKVTVELGRTKMAVSDLLNLGQGSVIELSKLAGEPLEVFVNDKLIAKGEAVVVNEKFGVRLLDIISPKERVEQLR